MQSLIYHLVKVIVHHPALYHEIIHALRPKQGGLYVDGTLGAGGHALGILKASGPDGLLLGMDVDPQALDLARERLSTFGQRAIIVRASYTTMAEQLAILGWEAVDGIVFDLGLSSMQLDSPQRGFSYRLDAPLDMRYDPDNPVRAADLVNHLPEKDLADLLYRYAEERRSRQVARAIVKARPINNTLQLAEVVARVVPSGRTSTGRMREGRRRQHPATRTFQALRIAVNQELDAVKNVLPQAVAALGSGGRIGVISFHSLEDRIVKQYFRRESQACLCPPRQPICSCGHSAVLREITRRPLRPQEGEIADNPRSRSARLRVAVKL